MTFLELVQRFCAEAGISSTSGGPSTVTGQSGEMLRAVNWVAAADQDIQNLRDSWEFMRFDVSFSATSTVQSYTPTAAGYPQLQRWKTDAFRIYLTSTGATDETWLNYVPWTKFRDVRLFGANRTVTGKPIEVTVKPDKTLMLWPIPDATYTVVGEYFKRAQLMDSDSDEPLYPSQYHLLPVWKAMTSYGLYEPAPEALERGQREFNRMISGLNRDQLPQIGFARPLV